MAGTSLVVVKPGHDLEQAQAAVMQEISNVIHLSNENERDENVDETAIQEISRIQTCKEGVYVQAPSLGTLEAIIEHLKTISLDVPVSGCNLGPVHKQDVMKATAMLKRKEEYAAILAFDVKVMPEAFDLAAESGVKIFTADTVYKLVDSFTDHITKLNEAKKKQHTAEAVFPCSLKILPNRVYHSKDPIVCDVEVLEGIVKVFSLSPFSSACFGNELFNNSGVSTARLTSTDVYGLFMSFILIVVLRLGPQFVSVSLERMGEQK